jgi:hypothetical protein
MGMITWLDNALSSEILEVNFNFNHRLTERTLHM